MCTELSGHARLAQAKGGITCSCSMGTKAFLHKYVTESNKLNNTGAWEGTEVWGATEAYQINMYGKNPIPMEKL